VLERLEIPEQLEVPCFSLHGVPIYCAFAEQINPPRKQNRTVKTRTAGRPARAVVRDVEQITGIVIHQTAVEFGISRQQLANSKGDRTLALVRRSLQVRCHAMSFDGFVAWPNDLRWYVIHGNGFNETTLSLEVEGQFPGLANSPGRGDTPLSPKRLAAARAGVALLVRAGRSLGMPIKYIYAHRQSSGQRRACPGEAIWRHVVCEYAVDELGLEPRCDLVLNGTDGRGRPIPRAWDPRGVGDY
jgi:hypothetical protein